MSIHVTDPVPVTEAEQAQALLGATPWAYRRAPLVYAVCEIYERCHCGDVKGDPYAWILAFHNRVTLYDDGGELLGSYKTVDEAVDAYAKIHECMARPLRLDYDPAHRDPNHPVPHVRLP